MIAPNMATMLSFIVSNIPLEKNDIKQNLKYSRTNF